jgi:chaperone BCS1
LSAGGLSNFESAVSTLPEKSILVIEDIDCNMLTHDREEIEPNDIKMRSGKVIESLKELGLAELLNSLDGLFSSHGRILLTITNHIEKLDKALIRPGRIDLKIEVGFVNQEILKLFFDKFFPDNNINTYNFNLKNNLTIAQLQNLVLENKNINDILDYVIKE